MAAKMESITKILQDMIDKTTPSKKWLKLTTNLAYAQASLILQLCSGYIGLNKHLHHIKQINSPACPNCNDTLNKTIQHFLFECNKYCSEKFMLQRKLGHLASHLSYLLTNPVATTPILNYIHAMSLLKQTFSNLSENP